jgi:uncharacterized membrane protein YhaH (DUF805 family)
MNCPKCNRPSQSKTSPRCVFCGAPLVEGELSYEEKLRALQKPAAAAAESTVAAVVIEPAKPVSALAYEGSASMPSGRSIGFVEVLWGIDGRISRSEFWLKGLLPLLAVAVVLGGPIFLLKSEGLRMATVIVLNLLLLFPFISIYAKRLHDRGRTAKWLFATLIPIVGSFVGLWILLETWFCRGELGPNNYGADPLDTSS